MMSKLSPTRINLVDSDQKWFYDRFPESNVSHLVRTMFSEFRLFADGKEEGFEIILNQLKERINGDGA